MPPCISTVDGYDPVKPVEPPTFSSVPDPPAIFAIVAEAVVVLPATVRLPPTEALPAAVKLPEVDVVGADPPKLKLLVSLYEVVAPVTVLRNPTVLPTVR